MNWRWLAEETVLAIHDEQLAEHGGASGVRDRGLMSSALSRPQNMAAYGEPDVAALAAAYAFGLLRNHAFVDGNKRVALAAAEVFLELNGWAFEAADSDCVTTIVSVASGDIDETGLAAWIRQHAVAR